MQKIFKCFLIIIIVFIKFFICDSLALAAENCEYIFSIPPVFEENASNSYITLYVISSEETEVIVEVPAEYYNKKKSTPSQALMFEIDASFAQVTKWNTDSRTQPPPASKIYKNRAIRVIADKPILCYVICQYYCTSDGFIAFPISYLNNEYIISSFPDMGGFYGDFYYPSETTITAAHDDTKVNFILGGNSATKVLFQDTIYYSGDTLVSTLNKGDVWLIMSDGAREHYPDLSGSKVVSSKSVAVTSGNVCANVPVDKPSCDYIATMEFPTNIWGKEYLVPPISRRKKSHLVRIYAKEDSTLIYQEGKLIDTIFTNNKNNYLNKNKNWIEMRLGSSTPEPILITGNKPIYVNFFYSSWAEDTVSLTDPFTTPILPIEIYTKSVSFSTPQAATNNPFDSNYINIVCAKEFDLSLLEDFSINYYDENSNLYEFTASSFELVSSGDFSSIISEKSYSYFSLKLPASGLYTINSKIDFACYLYGLANVMAYGFPVFPMFAFSKNIDKEAPKVVANMLCDGSVINGTITDLPEYGYKSNLKSVVLLENESYNINFSYNPFAIGISDETSWNLSVENIKFDAKASIKVSDLAGNTDTFNLKYYGLDGMYLKPIRNSICIDSLGSDTIIYELCNPKEVEMKLNLFLHQDSNILTIVSPTQVVVPANSSTILKLNIKFDNSNENKFLVLQKCYESDTILLPIEYKITNYAINITPELKTSKYSIGDNIKFNLNLSSKNSTTEELKKITELQLKIKYKNIFAFLDTMNINLFSMPNWIITNKTFYKDSDSSIIFLANISNPNGLALPDLPDSTNALNSSENLSIETNFKLMLPLNVSSDFYITPEDYKLKLYSDIESNYYPCASFYSTPAEILINPICADKLRLIKTSQNDFNLAINNSIIKYSLGFDCNVSINIYNTIGVNIKNIINQDCKSGNYEVPLDNKLFSPGIYFCELNIAGFLRKVVVFFIL